MPETVAKRELALNIGEPPNGDYEMTRIGKYSIFARIEYETDPTNPLDSGQCNGNIYSLNTRHRNFSESDVRDAMENNPDAVPLAYYEHGQCMWGLAAEMGRIPGVEWQWDGTPFAGVWVPDSDIIDEVAGMEPGSAERKAFMRARASDVCEAYTDWCNGNVYAFDVKVYETVIGSDGEPWTSIGTYEDDGRELVGEEHGNDILEARDKPTLHYSTYETRMAAFSLIGFDFEKPLHERLGDVEIRPLGEGQSVSGSVLAVTEKNVYLSTGRDRIVSAPTVSFAPTSIPSKNDVVQITERGGLTNIEFTDVDRDGLDR